MDYEMWKKDLKLQNFWRKLLDVITEKERYYRVKLFEDNETTRWEDWLIEPIECCIESGFGPIGKWEVEWIEIDPIFEIKKGKGVPSEWVDDTQLICEKLAKENIEFEIINHFIRIQTAPKKVHKSSRSHFITCLL